MTCEDFQARHLAGESSPAQDAHVGGCAACRSSLSGLNRLRQALAEPAMWETPGDGLADLVVDELTGRRSVRPGASRWLGWAVAVAAVAAAFTWWAIPPSPDWEVDLVSMPYAPSAQASVAGWQSDEGTRMRFEVSGLAHSGDDAYYEIWLTAADGRHVSGGTFTGSGVVEASIGVARRDFPRVWITLEPADDDLGPSRTVVFDDPGR